jgi:signal transduction histidine kinase
MWAMLAPVGALMFQGSSAARWWFSVFIALTVISGFSERYLSSHIEPIPEVAITAFFALNFICAFFLIFSSVYYYVSENKRILAIISEQTDKLMQMDQIKNRFFANLSHEFRTPLALTIGPLEDAIQGQFGKINKPLHHQLEVMLRNSQRLLRLINQLLDISKIESGEMKLENGLEYEGPARIGIHQDYVTVGNFGSHNLMEYTAVGRGINLASRLEASCTPGRIKVSYPIYLLTKDGFDYGEAVEEGFKGFSRKIRVCELDPGLNI